MIKSEHHLDYSSKFPRINPLIILHYKSTIVVLSANCFYYEKARRVQKTINGLFLIKC